MQHIFILEDQTKCLELIKRVAHTVFGTQLSIQHASNLKKVNIASLSDVDIAFFDLSLPDGFSFELIEQCKARHADTPIIVTSLYADDDMVFKALRAGADGYLLKSDGEKKLTRCLQHILDGEPPISPHIARKLMTQFRTDEQRAERLSENQSAQQPTPELAKLTQRETDVLAMIAQGMPTKEIAIKLDLSVHTISDYIKSIYRKLKINSRAQATAVALQAGLA